MAVHIDGDLRRRWRPSDVSFANCCTSRKPLSSRITPRPRSRSATTQVKRADATANFSRASVVWSLSTRLERVRARAWPRGA